MVGNPPVDIARSQFGELVPLDSENHPFLFSRRLEQWGPTFAGDPAYTVEEYLNRAVFETAFGKIITLALDELTKKW